MPKLWVDDVKAAPDEGWAIARNFADAHLLLARFYYDEVALDHDLGDDGSPTGYDLLTAMERGELHRPVRLRIISWNVAGVQRMKAAARAMGLPFIVDIEDGRRLTVETCPDL